MKSICMAAMSGSALVVGASAAHAQEQKPPMGFFVTSSGMGKGGDLGGLAGADAHCQALAQAAGAGGREWRAYLSTEEPDKRGVFARHRIGEAARLEAAELKRRLAFARAPAGGHLEEILAALDGLDAAEAQRLLSLQLSALGAQAADKIENERLRDVDGDGGHDAHRLGARGRGRAVRQARRKARRAGVSGQTTFLVGDVTRLNEYGLSLADFALDIGCLHSLTPEGQARYAAGLSALTRPGAIFLLYAIMPCIGRLGPVGLSPEAVQDLFAPHFNLVDDMHGHNEVTESESAWYRLERMA